MQFSGKAVAIAVSTAVLASLIVLSARSIFETTPSCPGCNVVFVELDVLNRKHLSAYGYFRNTTPNIDALASDRSAFLFTEAYSPTPFSCESDKSVLTGLKLSEAGICGLYYKGRKVEETSNENLPWLPAIFRARGYTTAAFVSGGTLNSTQLERAGFSKIFEGDFEPFQTIEKEAVSWLSGKEESGPFFLFLTSYDLHDPYIKVASENSSANGRVNYSSFGEISARTEALDLDWTRVNIFYGESKEAGWKHSRSSQGAGGAELTEETNLTEKEVAEIISAYDSTLLENDRVFGDFIRFLKEKGLYEKTVIVFTSEHGEGLGEYGWFGHGTSLPDTTEIPLIIYVPGARGGVLKGPVSTVNVYHTLLEITGISGGRGKSVFMEGNREYAISELPEFYENLSNPSGYKIHMRKGNFMSSFFMTQGLAMHEGLYPIIPQEFSRPVPSPIYLNGKRMAEESSWSDSLKNGNYSWLERYWASQENYLSERSENMSWENMTYWEVASERARLLDDHRKETMKTERLINDFVKILEAEYPHSRIFKE